MTLTRPVPLLLLHGFPLTAAMWRRSVAHYEVMRPVLAPDAADLAGGALGRPSMAAMADAAVAAMDAAGWKGPVVVAGLSMGGYVAQELAARHPGRVAALVLCDTRCSADTPEARANRDAMIAAVESSGVLEGTAPLVGKLLSLQAPPEVAAEVRAMVETGHPDVIVALVRALRDRADHCATLEAFEGPALALRGEDDALAPRDVTEEMARRLRRGRFAEIPAAWHLPPMENPEVFHWILDGFLAENGF